MLDVHYHEARLAPPHADDGFILISKTASRTDTPLDFRSLAVMVFMVL